MAIEQSTLSLLRIPLALALLASLSGCDGPVNPSPRYEPDQAKRIELFKMCMAALPAGPVSTKYNDWDEVVSACGSEAYYMSMVCVENCPAPEKRP